MSSICLRFAFTDALRRFDSPIKGESTILTPTASKVMVEAMVTNVVAKQLQLPSLVTKVQPTISELPCEDRESSNDETVSNLDGDGAEDKKTSYQETTTNSDCDGIDGHVALDGDQNKDLPRTAKKMSALGVSGSGESGESSLAKTGDTRRAVLKSLMTKGMSGSHTIAAGAATGVQRQLKELERRKAVELLLTGDEPMQDTKNSSSSAELESSRQELLSLGIRSVSTERLDDD